MAITNVSAISSQPPGSKPAAPVAPAAPAIESKVAEEAAVAAVAPVEDAPEAPPPPPPVEGFDFDVNVGEHEATGRKVYDFVDPDSGESVVQIPVDAVLNLVASILAKLEAEGMR